MLQLQWGKHRLHTYSTILFILFTNPWNLCWSHHHVRAPRTRILICFEFWPFFISLLFYLHLLMWTRDPRPSSLNLLDGRRSSVVTWLSPQENDTFGSWDTLTVKWNSQEVLDSPSFRLCTLPDNLLQVSPSSQDEMDDTCLGNSCGSKISPVVEESDGSFFTSFTVPHVADDAFFLLQMNDASGAALSSPIFKLSSHPICTRLPPRPNFTLETDSQGSPFTSTPRRPSSALAGYIILLIVICLLLMIAPLLWLYRSRKLVKMYFRRLRDSHTVTPALLQKVDPGDGTSIPIPLFMPTQRRSRAPSRSTRQPSAHLSLGRASGMHQPLHTGSSRSFRLPSRYTRGSTYPSLPPIPISSNTFINEGDTMMMNSALGNIHVSCRPLLPPGLVSPPLKVHLRTSD